MPNLTEKNVGSSSRASGVIMKFGSGITPNIPVHCKLEIVGPALIPEAFGNATRKLFHSDFLTFCCNLSLIVQTAESSLDSVTSLQFLRTLWPIACLWMLSPANQASPVCVIILLYFPPTFADGIKTSLLKMPNKRLPSEAPNRLGFSCPHLWWGETAP